MATKSPTSVSQAALIKAIDKAVGLAAKRHADIGIGATTIQDRWEIIGRVVTDATDLNDAFAFAKDVASSLKVTGLKPDPAVVRLDKKILVGFIDRGGLPRQLSGG